MKIVREISLKEMQQVAGGTPFCKCFSDMHYRGRATEDSFEQCQQDCEKWADENDELLRSVEWWPNYDGITTQYDLDNCRVVTYTHPLPL